MCIRDRESLWVYQDALGGQPNCPIAYADGYIYTGFWNSETKQANFACLSVTDEDATKTNEAKLPTWTYTHNGFYCCLLYTSGSPARYRDAPASCRIPSPSRQTRCRP